MTIGFLVGGPVAAAANRGRRVLEPPFIIRPEMVQLFKTGGSPPQINLPGCGYKSSYATHDGPCCCRATMRRSDNVQQREIINALPGAITCHEGLRCGSMALSRFS